MNGVERGRWKRVGESKSLLEESGLGEKLKEEISETLDRFALKEGD
jgi:hypothetical protein